MNLLLWNEYYESCWWGKRFRDKFYTLGDIIIYRLHDKNKRMDEQRSENYESHLELNKHDTDMAHCYMYELTFEIQELFIMKVYALFHIFVTPIYLSLWLINDLDDKSTFCIDLLQHGCICVTRATPKSAFGLQHSLLLEMLSFA